jgi:hypothetical protein
MKIEIKNCRECPFCNNDNEYGHNFCNLGGNFLLKLWEELPNDKRHEDCLLSKESYEVIGS